jgi:hypothetical protein
MQWAAVALSQTALYFFVVEREGAADPADVRVGDLGLHAIVGRDRVGAALARRVMEDVVASLGPADTLDAVAAQDFAEGAQPSRHGRRRAALR